jgi:triacylglycerol lipase
VTVEASLPRFGLPLTLPQPRLLSEWASTRDRRAWPIPPAGNGQPVMLIPGFLAGDASLTRMALWLRGGGYELIRSGIAWNTNCMQETVDRLQARLEAAVAESGRPVLIIGQSRGGSIGRALATMRPDLIGTLVTLGSPLLNQLAVAPRVWPSLITVGLMGSLGVPGMFSLSCVNGECCTRVRDAMSRPFPDPVGFLSFYSRSDEIVRWRACLDPAATHVEVHTSHVGMGMAREVWTELSARLAG